MKIVFDDGVCDDVDAEPLAETRFRLLATPMASNTAARYGDVLELSEEGAEGEVWRFVRIAEPSPFVTLTADAVDDDLLVDLRGMGGEVEVAFGGIIYLHVPPSRVEGMRQRLATSLSR
jgi:hypothetical protein